MLVTETKKLSEAKQLYKRAFPKEERLPWWVLRFMTLHEGVALTAYYHNCEFWGFTHTTVTEDVVFVMFFAVQDELRGKGCGSAILEYLKQHNPGKAIVLHVEPLDDTAENAAQRIDRMRFYERNGFWDTGFNIAEVGGVFRVLSTRPVLDVDAHYRVFRRLSFGLWRPEITAVR